VLEEMSPCPVARPRSVTVHGATSQVLPVSNPPFTRGAVCVHVGAVEVCFFVEELEVLVGLCVEDLTELELEREVGLVRVENVEEALLVERLELDPIDGVLETTELEPVVDARLLDGVEETNEKLSELELEVDAGALVGVTETLVELEPEADAA
jgi:hypothetical protein